MRKRLVLALGLVALVATTAAFTAKHGPGYSWHLTPTGVDPSAHYRGLSVVNDKVVWASGYVPGTGPGLVVRTTDRGKTWQSVAPPGSATLQFRDVQAFDTKRAVILASGTGTDSRVYVTSNGGASWTLAFTNTDPAAFYDCMSFWDKRHGIAVSDPGSNGKFEIIATSDGGLHWSNPVSPTGMPDPLPGEAGFAASGECLVTGHGRHAWFGSGGASPNARVFRTNDGGKTWQVSATPIDSGPSAGINGVAFRDDKRGIAVGGDFFLPATSLNTVAITKDGGKSWQLAKTQNHQYRSGVHWLHGDTAIDVGLTGSDVSTDGGNTWTTFDTGSFDTIDCAGGDHCWASGAGDRVAYLVGSH